MNYDNFDILITEDRVTITGSEQGVQAPEMSNLASDIQHLQDILDQIAANRVDARLLDEFGDHLAGVLFKGNLWDCFYHSLAYAEGRGHGLRVRLQIQSENLQLIPWEFMKVRGLDQSLAISPRATLSRYPVISQWIEPLTIIPPMRILAMISNPRGDLDVDREWNSILQATESLRSEGQIQIDRADANKNSLRDRLRQSNGYHVFHFIGHGRFDRGRRESLLVFEDGPVDAPTFSSFFLGRDTVRLVVLNACETAVAAIGVAQKLTMLGIPGVVAMQYKIKDRAATAFSKEFYEALVRDATLDTAVTEGRRAIFTSIGRHVRDWGTPVLFTRSSDGRIFGRSRRELMETLMEWKDLHKYLQDIDTSFDSIRSSARKSKPDIGQISELWDACKRFITQLMVFAKNIKHIGNPYAKSPSGETVGEPWVVEPIMIGKEISTILRSDKPDERVKELRESISKFYDSISRHLIEADIELRRVAKELL